MMAASLSSEELAKLGSRTQKQNPATPRNARVTVSVFRAASAIFWGQRNSSTTEQGDIGKEMRLGFYLN
jgi:hypothetical protein